MQEEDLIQQIKDKANNFARTHATENAKNYYLLGKKDAVYTFLAMIREDGVSAIIDIANEVLKHDPEQPNAKWVIENHENFHRNNS